MTRGNWNNAVGIRRLGSLPTVLLGPWALLFSAAMPATGIEVLWTSPNTTVTVDPPQGLEFENPLTGTETVLGYAVAEWLDADYSAGPPRWYDDWSVSTTAIDGYAHQIWMRTNGHHIWTTSTVPGSMVSIHLAGDENDGLADVEVDGSLVAQLDMGTPGGAVAAILVTDLPNTTHFFEIFDRGTGQLGGDDVATMGAAVLGDFDPLEACCYPDQPCQDQTISVCQSAGGVPQGVERTARPSRALRRVVTLGEFARMNDPLIACPTEEYPRAKPPVAPTRSARSNRLAAFQTACAKICFLAIAWRAMALRWAKARHALPPFALRRSGRNPPPNTKPIQEASSGGTKPLR